MRRLLPGLLGLLITGTSAAQPRPTPDRPSADRPEPAQQPPPQPGICCCRVWSRGWQYSWRPANECSAQNGTCVTPDHC